MCEPIMVACDLHDKTMVLLWAEGRKVAATRTLPNTQSGQERLLAWLGDCSRQAGGGRVIFAYEASSLGFGLYDALTAAGFECWVLRRRRFLDGRTATQKDGRQRRGADFGSAAGSRVGWRGLAGGVDSRSGTRDNREIVRTRLGLAEKSSAVKCKIQSLLNRNHLRRPAGFGKGDETVFWAWLRGLTNDPVSDKELEIRWPACCGNWNFFRRSSGGLDDRLLRLVDSPRVRRACSEVGGVGRRGPVDGLGS